jgi:hypothetical protein
MKEFVAGERCR